jgi:hypothetical protein
VKFAVIDPLTTYMHERVDSHKDHAVKRALTPISRLAQDTGCTIVGVHHLNKDVSKGARLSAQGSGAFYTTPRITITLAVNQEGLVICQITKSNIGPEGVRQRLRPEIVKIRAEDGSGKFAEVPLLHRAGETEETVDDVLTAPRVSKSAAARELIVDILRRQGGTMGSEALDLEVARKLDMSTGTIQKIRGEMKHEGLISPSKDGRDGPWTVELRQKATA